MDGALQRWKTGRFDQNPPPAGWTPQVKKRDSGIFKRTYNEECVDNGSMATDWDSLPEDWLDVSGLTNQIEDGTVNLNDPNCLNTV
jgi:hypothetical protein